MFEDTKKENYIFLYFIFDCNKYCKISKVLQYLLQNIKIVAILIAKSQSIIILCNTIGITPAHTYIDITASNMTTPYIHLYSHQSQEHANEK